VPYNSPPRRLSRFGKANGAVGEKTHEARNQDFHPDAWTSGHICIGRRSAGSRPGWIADSYGLTKTAASQVVLSCDDQQGNL
jgi:hypothetical protein